MSEYLAVVTRRSKKWSKFLQGTVKVEKNLKGGHLYLIFYKKMFHFCEAVLWLCSEAVCEKGDSE